MHHMVHDCARSCLPEAAVRFSKVSLESSNLDGQIRFEPRMLLNTTFIMRAPLSSTSPTLKGIYETFLLTRIRYKSFESFSITMGILLLSVWKLGVQSRSALHCPDDSSIPSTECVIC
jgi:hypothetical protein